MTEQEKMLNDACIESHKRMIAYHRRQIVELTRRALKVTEICSECFNFEIINESGRSGESKK